MNNDAQYKVIELIRDINYFGVEHYDKKKGDYSHSSYIRKCENKLHKFLSSYLGDAYLFSTLSFQDRRQGHIVNFADGSAVYKYSSESIRKIFQPIIEGENALLDKIQSGESFSLTTILLKNESGPDIIFEGISKYPEPIKYDSITVQKNTIFFIPINEITPAETPSELLKQKQCSEIVDFFEGEYQLDKNKVLTLLWYYVKMRTHYLNKYPDVDFMVHFLRPAFIDFDHNLLLSLATNRTLEDQELSTINLLIYKIVSLMATTQKIEINEMRRRTSFSLSTHGLKTEYETTLLPLKNDLVAKKEQIPNLPYNFSNTIVRLDEEMQNHYSLTGILALVDKIDSKKKFVKAGIRDNLLSKEIKYLSVFKSIAEFNKNPEYSSLVNDVSPELKISIQVYNVWFSEVFLRLFLHTIFQNISQNGIWSDEENKLVQWELINTEGVWVFSNEYEGEYIEYDENRLTGNLLLFSEIINHTGSGKFTVNPAESRELNKYKIVYNEKN